MSAINNDLSETLKHSKQTSFKWDGKKEQGECKIPKRL